MIPAKNRERKCSTCKHYQPSPLWRKGWCRNPLLYDRNTNHLVEAESLACNRTFIDYWEPNDGPPVTAGPQGRGTKPRIAPSIPMDTKDAQGRAGVVTGNTPAVGMPAVNPRQLYRPAPGRGRPPLSIVTPEFEDEDNALDPSIETRQIEQVGDERPTASQRIRKARAQRRFTLMGMSGPSLWVPLGIVAALLLLGGFAVFANNQRTPVVVSPTATVTSPPPSPTGFGGPTPTSPLAPTAGVVVPSDVIAINGWVQVAGAATGLTVRAEPSTSGARLGVMPEGTKAHVIDGPETANGFTWWKVDRFSKTNPELEGWAAATFLKPTTAP
ncbi:MAG: SH3 domain-containing protein [Chloroflexia bacterium]